jgi:molybdenum cofactor biosynthesis enzyme MoaA
MEKMTIHRALTELKTIDKRLDTLIKYSTWVKANKKSNLKIEGNDIESYKKELQGSFDKVIGLINRRNDIKTAVVKSNAVVMVTVADRTMTVAEAIERKVSIRYELELTEMMKHQFNLESGKVNKENELLPQRLESYLHSVTGTKDTTKSAEVEALTKSFMAREEWELIDPLKLKNKYLTLEEVNSKFLAEVDSVLSESNAVNFIEI